ncbi:MAG: hypothetical protein H0T89_20180 [Deltaproteobacteria bacterium]|nr:hypothetical protein [Deltaproteobacteria bacterium]MDQ3298423.1 hypothetical protein [Myxococcota bacterium]
MSERFEIRPGSIRPGQSRFATHSEVLLALKATAKQLGVVPHLPAGNRGDRWRASIDGLTVAGDTKREGDHVLETYCVTGPGVDHARLMVFAEHVAAIAGKQAVIGETEQEFWFVDKPAPKAKKSKAKSKTKRK